MSPTQTFEPPITDNSDLAQLLKTLEKEEVYALDTEFIGEGRYTPELALIQVAWRSGVATIDPLDIDPNLLADFFKNCGLTIMHSGSQDIKILMNYCGEAPLSIYDTQIAGGFLGMGHPSLNELVQTHAGINLPKNIRLTDWLQRPLSKYQILYAQADVQYLIQIYDILIEELLKRGRAEWVEQECESVRSHSLAQISPENAWKSIKRARSLSGSSLQLLQELAMWREIKAQTRNLPRQRLLSDMGILTIAQMMPDDIQGIRGMRGAHGSILKSPKLLNEALHIISRYKNNSTNNSRTGSDALSQAKKAKANEKIKNRPAFSLLLAWLNACARDLEIHPPLLATQNDLIEFLSEPSHGRLSKGWRAELLAKPLEKIANGEAAIALNKNRVVLEERSARALQL